MKRPFPHRPGLAALCLSAAILSGCHDASSDPLAVILAEETRSVLAAEANLPSLPRLAAEARADERLGSALEHWSRSWELPLEEGRPLRIQAAREALDPLLLGIGPSGVASAVRSVGETLMAVEAIEAEQLPEQVAENIEEAELEHERAVTALAEGRQADALGAALQAADLIREVGPESVSRLLLARADARLNELNAAWEASAAVAGAVEAAEPTDGAVVEDPVQVDLERARRLIRGARLALEQGDWVRAIQRAYYACQMLGIDATS